MTWYHGKTWRDISVLFPSLAKNTPTEPISEEACNRIAEVAALCRIAAAAEKIAAWMDPNQRRIAVKKHAALVATEKRWDKASVVVDATFGKSLPIRWRVHWVTIVGESMADGSWNARQHDLVALAYWARGHVRHVGARSAEKLAEQARAVGGVAKDPAAADGAQA